VSWAGRAPSQQDGKPARLPRDTASILNSQITEMLKEMDNASKQAGKSDLEMLRAQLELERVALERERERTNIRKKHRYTAELFGILQNFFLSVTFQVLQCYIFLQSVTFLVLSVTIWLTVLLFKFCSVTFSSKTYQVLLLKSKVLLFWR